MSAINQYLKEKLSKILPASNQFTIEVKLQIILRMKQDPNYEMTSEDYEDIEQYCYDVLEIIDRLAVGECFVKGLLYHEILTAKVKLAELRDQVFDDVSSCAIQFSYFARTVAIRSTIRISLKYVLASNISRIFNKAVERMKIVSISLTFNTLSLLLVFPSLLKS